MAGQADPSSLTFRRNDRPLYRVASLAVNAPFSWRLRARLVKRSVGRIRKLRERMIALSRASTVGATAAIASPRATNMRGRRHIGELHQHLTELVWIARLHTGIGSPHLLDTDRSPGVVVDALARPPPDLAQHNCARFRFSHSGAIYKWELQVDGRLVEYEIAGNLTISDSLFSIALAYTFDRLVLPHIRARKLKRILNSFSPTFPGFYLY